MEQHVNALAHPAPEAFALHLTTIPAPRIWVSQQAAGAAIVQVKGTSINGYRCIALGFLYKSRSEER